MPTPTSAPKPSPAPAPTTVPPPTNTPPPSPTSTPEPEPIDWSTQPERPGLDQPIHPRDQEYAFALDLSDSWITTGHNRYQRQQPWGVVQILQHALPDGTSTRQFAADIQKHLRQDWWRTPSRFQIQNVRHENDGEHETTTIDYLVQEAPQYCAVSVREVFLIADSLPDNELGIRLRHYTCQHDEAGHTQERQRIFESFAIATQPAYYEQYVNLGQVIVKAPAGVQPEALRKAAGIANVMLSGRSDIQECMARTGSQLAVIPKDRYVTDLPEYAYLAGRSDFTGRTYESFALRGLGAVKGQPVASGPEEQLIDDLDDHHPRYPYIALSTAHEFAHAIQNLCFNEQDHQTWDGLYAEALEEGIYPGTHMMANVMEFFAVVSTAYFEVTTELDPEPSRARLAEDFPEIVEALDEIYQGATFTRELARRTRER
ncbi:MAG: hypothetical protein OXF79_20760 [Chloroflexi bacterium]|nr:hypothetical protein [Chloroflexota bacterium]